MSTFTLARRDPDGLTVHVVPPGYRGDGFRVGDTQIFLEHDPAIAAASPPMRRGFTYPHGNWIEILQYAHLSGELPDIDRIADNWDEVIAWRETGNVPVA